MKINGSAVVITGAAGKIGRSLALGLEERKVGGMALVDFTDAVHDLAREVNDRAGRNLALGFSGDPSDPAFRKQVFRKMTQEFGPTTIYVPAPGMAPYDLSDEMEEEKNQASFHPAEMFRQVVEVNLIAPLNWALEMVAGIAERRAARGSGRWLSNEPLEGVVVFTGSISLQGNNGQVGAAACKAGFEGGAATLMVKALYHGVRCGVIHPNYIDTPLVRALGEKYIDEYILPGTQVRRLILPREMADAICLMISKATGDGLVAEETFFPSGAGAGL